MKKVFKAYGALYKCGDTIGLTDKTLSDEVMRKIVTNSPLKVPVVSDLGKAISGDPDYNIGYAILGYQPAGVIDGEESRIVCTVFFNDRHRKEYETILNSSKERSKLRFGFLLSKVRDAENDDIVSGIISAISLNDTGLGSNIISYGWEDEMGD